MRIRRDDQDEEVFLNLTAFIDMMLVLVIFFLATSRFHEEERDEKIRLAQLRSSLPIATAAAKDIVVINIDKEGRKAVDGQPKTIEELELLLRARRDANAAVEVVIRADIRGLMEPFAQTTGLCHRLGIKSPSIAYVAGEEGGR